MSSEAITQNDLREILSRTVGSIPSEYKKLLWTNPSPTSAMSGGTTIVASGADEYDAIEVEYKTAHIYDGYETASAPFVVGAHITLFAPSGLTGEFTGQSVNAVRTISMGAGGLLMVDGAIGMTSSGTTSNNNMCIPYKVYGIKYERVQPPVLDAEIEVLATGITLYRIGRIRALHISDATGFTKSSLIPSADRPSADIQGVAIRTTNGNLATSFGRIVVGSNGDVGALYSSVLNGSQTGFSVASSTDHIIGTAIWYVAE